MTILLGRLSALADPRRCLQVAWAVAALVVLGLMVGTRDAGETLLVATAAGCGLALLIKVDPKEWPLSLALIGWLAASFVSDSKHVGPVATVDGAVSLSPQKILPLLLQVVGVGLYLLQSRRQSGRWAPLSRSGRLLVAYLALLGTASLVSPLGQTSLMRWVQGAVPAATALVVMASGKRVKHLLGALMVALTVHVFIAVFIFRNVVQYKLDRASGFLHPDVLAVVAALLATIGVWLVMCRRGSHDRLFGCALVGLGWAAIYVSHGRTGAVAGVVGMGVVMVTGYGSRRSGGPVRSRAAFVVPGAICLAVVVILSGSSMTTWFARGNAAEITTLTGRTRLWDAALDLAGQRPLIGWGAGALRAGEIAETVERETVGFAGHAHNAFVEATINSGFVGGLLWLAILIVCLKELLARSGRSRPLFVSLWAILAVASIADGSPAGFGALWMLLLALVAIAGQRDPAREPAEEPVALRV